MTFAIHIGKYSYLHHMLKSLAFKVTTSHEYIFIIIIIIIQSSIGRLIHGH